MPPVKAAYLAVGESQGVLVEQFLQSVDAEPGEYDDRSCISVVAVDDPERPVF